MTKKATYEVLAAQYFVERQMSVAGIAKKLNISEKTIHTWKKDGNWEEKRTKFLKAQYSTNQTLYELLGLMATKAVDDYKSEGTIPDQKTLYFIMNMSDKLYKLKKFEEESLLEKIEEVNTATSEQAEDKKAVSDEILQKVFTALVS